MSILSTEELAEFVTSIDGVLAKAWPSAHIAADDADGSALKQVWQLAVQQGWTNLAYYKALDAAITACGRLGRVACPFPLMDIYVSAIVLGKHSYLVDQVVDGTIRPVVVVSRKFATKVRFVEAAPAATHVLEFVAETGEARLCEIVGFTTTPGLAKPDWTEVRLKDQAIITLHPGEETFENAKVLLRLGLVARAVGAARRTWELSLEHAKNRVSFGKPIGSYQAVSHRIVDGAVDMTACDGLISQAVESYQLDRSNWHLSCELAVEYSAAAAIRTQFGGHHTLAAQGYFEEHEAPWLFRRINTDVVLLSSLTLAKGQVADILVEDNTGLPFLELGSEAEEFRSELKQVLAPFDNNVPVGHSWDDANKAFSIEAVKRGYLTMAWPVSFGGQDGPAEKQMVLTEEIGYHRLSLLGKDAADLVGTAIIYYGTPEQQERILPLIASGNFSFYVAYSEPDVGSDLANLKSKAVRDGDEWVINGRKEWGTGAHRAEWIWLATRTDPDSTPPHRGITVFLTRTDQPGFEIQHHRSLSGTMSSSTFLDDFRVSDSDRVGEVNQGWKVITKALVKERVIMANFTSGLLRLLDDMLYEIRKDPVETLGPRGSAKRALISELASRLQATRVLLYLSVREMSIANGRARLEGPMAKMLSAILHEDFGKAALQIFGPAAALGEGLSDVPGRGAFEYNLRFSIRQAIGGGTIDIQKNMIAYALGLPR